MTHLDTYLAHCTIRSAFNAFCLWYNECTTCKCTSSKCRQILPLNMDKRWVISFVLPHNGKTNFPGWPWPIVSSVMVRLGASLLIFPCSVNIEMLLLSQWSSHINNWILCRCVLPWVWYSENVCSFTKADFCEWHNKDFELKQEAVMGRISGLPQFSAVNWFLWKSWKRGLGGLFSASLVAC